MNYYDIVSTVNNTSNRDAVSFIKLYTEKLLKQKENWKEDSPIGLYLNKLKEANDICVSNNEFYI